jgi:hypothetical protein
MSGVLVMVSMFVDPVPSATGRELIEGYYDDQFRAGLHTNLIHYGFALLAPVAFAMVGLVRHRGAALANVAGVLAVIGLSTLPGLVLMDLTSTAVARATDVETAFAAEEQLGQMPGFVLLVIPALLGVALALPLAVTAMWRAGLVPGVIVPVSFVAMVAPNFVPWWVGFSLQLVWLLALAYLLWRLPLSAWTRGGPAPAPETRSSVPATA